MSESILDPRRFNPIESWKFMFIMFPRENIHNLIFQKMVCTSIRPTTLPYVELEDWQGLVSFFGDHMDYEPLEIATLFVSNSVQ